MTIHAVFGSPLPDVTLRGPNVELRCFDRGDLPLIQEASADEFIPVITTVPESYSPAEGLAFIDRQNFRLASGEGWSLAIVDAANQQAVGQIGLWISQLSKGRAEIGYWVAPSGRGSRAASHAVRLLSDWAFENLDVERLGLYIEPWNSASIKTAEYAGFNREALLKNWERVGGIPKDMWSYVRLRDPLGERTEAGQ